MDIFFSILKAIAGWILLTLIGTNLIGLSVRGLFDYDKGYDKNSVAQKMLNKYNQNGHYISIISCLVTICYLFALYHYWNWGISLSGALLMLSRLPDLLFEINTGQKLTLENMPKRKIDFVFGFIQWGTLPLIWYSLYYLK